MRSARTDRPHGDSNGRLDDDAAVIIAVPFAGELSELILGFHDPILLDCACWAVGVHQLEMAYAQLRVDERSRTYVIASGQTWV